MRHAIIQPLSPTTTHWTGRQHYHIDTVALLLAGADPASIETKEPENITVDEAWAAPAFATGSKVWRERLVRAALAGDLPVSNDGEPGTVGVWGSNGRWSPMSVDEAARLEKVYEVRSHAIFFDIGRRELARWLESEGGALPFWLAAGDNRDAESSVDGGRWWYVVPLRWALATGQPAPTDGPTLLADIARDMARVTGLAEHTMPKPHAAAQREAAQAALQRQSVNMDGEVPSKSRGVVGGLWAYAAYRDNNTDVTDADALADALKNAGVPCPSHQQLMSITDLF